ncbi:MAG: c-type cytochrome [Syntrophales bacterium]|nr:c-type cytochrome [Syntrophales bacterium]
MDAGINAFYNFLNDLGFPDPIHAAMVHMPMGLVVGAFFFAGIAALTRWKMLAVSARHCIGLAFLFLFPVITFGIIDWRHFYGGAWLTPIKMKMILAGMLFLLSLAALVTGSKGREASRTTLALYVLCFITVVLLGWFGARLVYGEKSQARASKTYDVGAKIFAANCNICHANGGNKIKPDEPLRGSPDLRTFQTFLTQLRHPEVPMPTYTKAQISDKDAKELYDYIMDVINCPPPGAGAKP